MTTDTARGANSISPSSDDSLRGGSAESCTAPIDSIASIAREMRERYACAPAKTPCANLVHQHAVMVAADLARWAERLEAIKEAGNGARA